MAVLVNMENLQKMISEIEKNSNGGSQKICVVGIIGRCHLTDKDGVLNQLVDHQVFKTETPYYKGAPQSSLHQEVEVKMFHDEEQNTVFLQLNTIYDSTQLLRASQCINPNLTHTGKYHYWQMQILKDAAAMLFIFSVSHVVVVIFPTPRFDLSYIRLCKLLASARYTMLHNLSQALGTVENIPEIWKSTGRPCIPRIIFSFQTPWKNTRCLNEGSMRRHQQLLQEQVHLILKKNRLLGSLSSSSLFTVSSPNQLFVHVQSPHKTHVDPKYFCLNQMLKNSVNLEMIYSNVFHKKSNTSIVSQPSPVKHSDGDAREEMTLRDFLYKQIDYMMMVESHEVPVEGKRGTHVEAPNILLWYQVCQVVYRYFIASDNNAHLKSLAQLLDLDWKFSENRCIKVTPMATNVYLDNLPSHYTQSVHLNQLSQCLHVFAMNARGPAYEHYATQLQDDCNQVWWNGRHLCEGSSMTGQPCVYPYHSLPDGPSDKSEDKTGVPVKLHSSRVTSVSACNCGRTQGSREDPFDLKTANYAFYQELEKQCCSYLIHLNFPSYPNEDNPCSTVASPIDSAPSLQKRLESHQIAILGRQPPPPGLTDLSMGTTPYSQQQLPVEDFTPVSLQGASVDRVRTVSSCKDQTTAYSLSFNGFMSADHKDEFAACDVIEETTLPLHSVVSTSTFDGMLTTMTPSSLLPMFPSWSLIVLGSSGLYNPLKGVEQVGFFSGSNYLLLWEIPLKSESKDMLTMVNLDSQEEQWPAPGEASKLPPSTPPPSSSSFTHSYLPLFNTITQVQNQAKELLQLEKSSLSKTKKAKDHIYIKAYIGNEYECPRGHRFFCSAPDKMVKVSGHVRENASKLVNANMPLYFPCPCRSSKPLHLAQIARTYVVTPDASITITLNPRVLPGDRVVTPVFCTGVSEGISLPPNSYCVLRFPYVYVDDNGPILPPAPTQPLLTCRLLRGMFNYSLDQSSTEENAA